jgi:hypothetical protein
LAIDFGHELTSRKNALVTDEMSLAPDDIFMGQNRICDAVELDEPGNVCATGFSYRNFR